MSSNLETAYDRILRLYEGGGWDYGPYRQVGLRLTSMDGPQDDTFEALSALVDYSQSELGIEFSLQGGGIGCFDLVLGAESDKGETIEFAILNDSHFQLLLADLRVHLVRLRVPTGTQAFAGYIPIKAGLLTNRHRNPHSDSFDPLSAFNSEFSEDLSLCLAEFHVLDFAEQLERSSLIVRIWKTLTVRLGDIREKRRYHELVQLDFLGKHNFQSLIKNIPSKSIIISIHGYANGFRTAANSFSEFIYKTGVDRLNHFPILFSWPSEENPITYQAQSRVALNSRKAFAESIQLLADVAGERAINIVAHSHGNDISVAVARDRALSHLPPRLRRLILVEPDIDKNYLSGEIELLAKAFDRLTVYHSKNDRALALASTLFGAKRAGQVGVEVIGQLAEQDAIDVIDASDVATGLSKHSPHIDVIEVVYDIRDTLEDRSPEDRALLPGVAKRTWKIRSIQ